jgi:hypothetical protein
MGHGREPSYVVILKEPRLKSMPPLHTFAATEGSTVGERRDMIGERIPSERTVDPSLRANVTDARQGASGASLRMTDMGHDREPS